MPATLRKMFEEIQELGVQYEALFRKQLKIGAVERAEVSDSLKLAGYLASDSFAPHMELPMSERRGQFLKDIFQNIGGTHNLDVEINENFEKKILNALKKYKPFTKHIKGFTPDSLYGFICAVIVPVIKAGENTEEVEIIKRRGTRHLFKESEQERKRRHADRELQRLDEDRQAQYDSMLPRIANNKQTLFSPKETTSKDSQEKPLSLPAIKKNRGS